MLNKAGIPHEFRDRTPPGGNEYGIKWGYQVIVYYPDGERMVSAIEGAGSYGFGGWDHGAVDPGGREARFGGRVSDGRGCIFKDTEGD